MSAAPVFSARTIQVARAGLAAIAALMITFSPDHSAEVGLSIFSGFAVATALVMFVAAWWVADAGNRLPYALLGLISMTAGILASVASFRTTVMFFVLVTSWALLSAAVEITFGLLARKRNKDGARDAITLGIFLLILSVALLLIPSTFTLDYTVDTDEFTLTGIILGVGAFGAWAWINAVFLAIAAFSPRRVPIQIEAPTEDALQQRDLA